jgi:hypothetical protein
MVAVSLCTKRAVSMVPGEDLGGTTIYPGIYVSSSSLYISSGDLTLDAQGDAGAQFIFKMVCFVLRMH